MRASTYTGRKLQEKETYTPSDALIKLYIDALRNFPRLKGYEHPFAELVNSIRTKVRTQTNNVNKLNRQVGVILQYFEILLSEMGKYPNVYPIKLGVINRLKGELNKLKNEVRVLPTNKNKINSTYARIERGLGSSLDEVMATVDACEDVSAGLCLTLYEGTDLTVETPHQPNNSISD